MCCCKAWWVGPICALIAVAGLAFAQVQSSSSAQKTDKNQQAAQQKRVPDLDVSGNPYLAPKTATTEQLVKYLEKMRTRPETIRRREGFGVAIVEAAERVLNAEPDDNQRVVAALALFDSLHERAVLGDDNANKRLMKWADKLQGDSQASIADRCQLHLLEQRLATARNLDATTDETAQLLADLETYFTANQLSSLHLRLASKTIGLINGIADVDQRGEQFDKFGELFGKSKDRQMQQYAKQILKKPGVDSSKLVGEAFEIEGTTLEGFPLDWTSYRGKVVLVDFWATWCGPCVAEMPNIKKVYQKYHGKGFEVIGISMDRDVDALKTFLAENQIPWTNLYDEGHPMAEKYSVNAIPFPVLVDQKGKVVTTQARGPALERELAKLLAAKRDVGN
ncbi:MAG: TlpA family protein disulfide reductase [Pirellulales bacterium]|nr:TlpA family protein disulfide reductase [Pirellulales bacterium]